MRQNSLETSSPTNVPSLVRLLVIAVIKSKLGSSTQVLMFRKTRASLSASLGGCNELGQLVSIDLSVKCTWGGAPAIMGSDGSD